MRGAGVAAAQVRLLQFDQELRRVDAEAQVRAIEREALLIGAGRRRKNDRIDDRVVARDVDRPGAVALGRRRCLRPHGELISAGLQLEGNDERTPLKIPIHAEHGALDVQMEIGIVAVADVAGLGEHLAFHVLRRSVGCDLRAQARRQRHVGFEPSFVQPQRKQQIAARYLARLEPDRAVAVGERTHSGGDQPRPTRIFRTDLEYDTALARPREARIDALEGPLLAVAPVVDDEPAVLEAEFAQIVAVETSHFVDPGEHARDVIEGGARSGRAACSCAGIGAGCGLAARIGATAVTIGCFSAPAKIVT